MLGGVFVGFALIFFACIAITIMGKDDEDKK